MQSRYYDPEVGRFINADEVKYIKKYKDIISANLYCYCNNNPISGLDSFGTASLEILSIALAILFVIAAIVTGVLVGIRAVQELHKTKSYKKSIGGGKFLQTVIHFFLGFVAGTISFIVTVASGKIITVVGNCVASVATNIMKAPHKKITIKKFIDYIYIAYTDEMGWSFLNKAFEKGIMVAILETLGGKLKDKLFDAIEEKA